MASANGFQHIVDVLLDKGTEIGCKDFNGNTPLHLAAHNGKVSVFESLLIRQTQIAYNQNHVNQKNFNCKIILYV